MLSSQLIDIKQHLSVGLNNFDPRAIKDLAGESTLQLMSTFNKLRYIREMPEDLRLLLGQYLERAKSSTQVESVSQ